MFENELHYSLVISEIRKIVGTSEFSVQSLLNNSNTLNGLSEYDIRKSINWSLKKGILLPSGEDKHGNSVFYFPRVVTDLPQADNVTISVTAPKLYYNSLKGVMERNGFITTTSAFEELISASKREIRVSSPFLQKDVASENSFPQLQELLLSAFKRGCRLIILSREVPSKRASDLKWIVDLAKRNGFNERVEIFDYHKSLKGGKVDSSTHAKLLIADNSMAYIGSAELRLNSLYRNFEVGVVIHGLKVEGLVELFDSMTNIARRVY